LIWHKIEIFCSKENSFFIEEVLIGFGAISLSIEDKSNKPIYEPEIGEHPLWDKLLISALFDEEINVKSLKNLIGKNFESLKYTKLKDMNWIENYQKDFQSRRFGQSLWVSPPWDIKEVKENEIVLKIAPGLAFGSGSHETTSLCLEYLDKNKPIGLSVIDYGCGSGILSIASILLGAKDVLAFDIDPQALISAKANALINDVEKRVKISFPPDKPRIKSDLLIANILVNQILALRKNFSRLLKQRSKLILSGIMTHQIDFVIKSYEKEFELISITRKKEWCLVEFEKSC